MRVNDHRLATLAYALLVDELILSKRLPQTITQTTQRDYTNAFHGPEKQKTRPDLRQDRVKDMATAKPYSEHQWYDSPTGTCSW